MPRRYGIGQKPISQRWDINFASPLVRQPLFVCALTESAPIGQCVQAKGITFNAPLTSLDASGPPLRQLGAGAGGVAAAANRIRLAPYFQFNQVGNDLRTLSSATQLPAQGLTYAIVRQCLTTTAGNKYSFGYMDTGGGNPWPHRAGGHYPYSDGVVYWDYGGGAAPNRLTWSGYTITANIETWVFVAGLNGMAIYLDGLQRASSATAVTRTQFADLVGLATGQSVTSNFLGLHFFAAFGSEWTASEVWAWSIDPYSIIRQSPLLDLYTTADIANPIPVPPGHGKPPPKPPNPNKPPGKDKGAFEIAGGRLFLGGAQFPQASYRPKFPIQDDIPVVPPVKHVPPSRKVLQVSVDGTKALRALRRHTPSATEPPAVVVEDGPHGPGFNLFGHSDGYHPPSQRTPKAETLERDLHRAFNRAHGIENVEDRAEVVRELKTVAAAALSAAKKEDDARLLEMAQQIIALKKLKLDVDAYLLRVELILAPQRIADAEDMDDLMFMASMV